MCSSHDSEYELEDVNFETLVTVSPYEGVGSSPVCGPAAVIDIVQPQMPARSLLPKQVLHQSHLLGGVINIRGNRKATELQKQCRQ